MNTLLACTYSFISTESDFFLRVCCAFEYEVKMLGGLSIEFRAPIFLNVGCGGVRSQEKGMAWHTGTIRS